MIEPQIIPRVLRPVAGFIMELALPISAICDIPELIDKVSSAPSTDTPM
jgi:hypothetical protein